MGVDDFDADVAIVGFGPVGVTAAHSLGRLGVRTIVLERDRDIYQRARAVTVNDWTLRIFQSFGMDEAVTSDMQTSGALRWRIYEGRKEVFRLQPEGGGLGHPTSMMIYQPAMEATLRRGVDSYAEHVKIEYGSSVHSVEQDETGVDLGVRDVAGEGERTVRARYVVACDGGSSTVRSQLGIKLLGETHEVTWIVIDGEVLRWWPNCDQLTFWADPKRPVVDIPLALGHHRWELPLREGEGPDDFDSDERLWSLLTPLGVDPANVRLKHHAFYVHHVRHVEQWRRDRVFLAGDAAHLMPPWAGQGMQSGIRDVDNLAWKLHGVMQGTLGDEVLDTYQAERAPQVAAVTALSQKMGQLIATDKPLAITLRNRVGPVLKRLPAVTRRMLPSTAPAIATGWLRGDAGKDSAVGRMIPQPEVCTLRGRRIRLDEALGDGFAVLALDADPRTVMSRDEVAGWEALEARFIAVRSPGSSGREPTDVIDTHGILGAWMRRYGTTAVAVRPDHFVAASQPSGMATPTPVGVKTAPGVTAASTPGGPHGGARPVTILQPATGPSST